ncbi:MAG: hypothetical protein WD342_03880 [Verrucomicrobiales bacterium]
MKSRQCLTPLVAFALGIAVPLLLSQQAKEAPSTAPSAAEKASPGKAKEKRAPKPKGKGKQSPQPDIEAIALVGEKLSLSQTGHQFDLPAAAPGPEGEAFVLYVDHDGEADQLRLAKTVEGKLEPVAAVGERGIVHAPAVAVDRDGTAWCFWGQTGEDDVVGLMGSRVDAEGPGEVFTVSKTSGSETFADAGIDATGRVWVAWQSTRNHRPDIYAKHRDPASGRWSSEIRVSSSEEGDREPRIDFDDQDNAWIVYDSARDNEFNLFLARVRPDGDIETWPIAHSPRYEARASIARAPDGKSFWIAAERGKIRWGLDSRGHDNDTGINARKSVLFGRFDIESESFEAIPLGQVGRPAAPEAPVNLPTVGIAPDGNPWVSYRYFDRVLWRIAVTRYDPKNEEWTSSRRLEGSSFGQDRTSHFLTGDGKLWLCWTSDLRDTKAPKEAGVYLAALDHETALPAAQAGGKDTGGDLEAPIPPSRNTPERAFSDRHTWQVDDEEYGLFWGDVHRHTDVSNCRTGFDGCINEQFRYAYDIAKLDFLGTSDHTDIGKAYSPYEWWHNQKMHDAFHTPERFNSLYVYEREQRWPWGHRNVVFAERGGPLVYIQRATYRNSPWQKDLPAKPGPGEIEPEELWDILERSGKNVAIVSHSGATRMGTDWSGYDGIDYGTETLVEIFQGARVSSEGAGAPQPTAGLLPGDEYTVDGDADETLPPAPIEDFGKYSQGLYQNALELGHRLGVFASSDHISTHVSYGGVFCKEFTREGIIEAFKARRTIAATDKIYVNFTCNERPLGSIFSAEGNPELWFRVDGTAALKRVTIVRNETDWKVFDAVEGSRFEKSVTDESPVDGENRYYLRVEQGDGNMAWTSPVWVTVE